MIEIGQHRMVVAHERRDGKLVPKLGLDGKPERHLVQDKVERVTKNKLDGSFGTDRKFRLKVRLLPGDILEIGPYTSRRRYQAEIKDVYRWLIWRYSNAARLERARAKKARIAQQRESRRLDRAEARMRRKLKEKAQ